MQVSDKSDSVHGLQEESSIKIISPIPLLYTARSEAVLRSMMSFQPESMIIIIIRFQLCSWKDPARVYWNWLGCLCPWHCGNPYLSPSFFNCASWWHWKFPWTDITYPEYYGTHRASICFHFNGLDGTFLDGLVLWFKGFSTSSQQRRTWGFSPGLCARFCASWDYNIFI